jgi:hypothetical protein
MGYSKADPQWIPNLKFYSHFSPVPTGNGSKTGKCAKQKRGFTENSLTFFKENVFSICLRHTKD